jgi:hypothetical protein
MSRGEQPRGVIASTLLRGPGSVHLSAFAKSYERAMSDFERPNQIARAASRKSATRSSEE